MNLNISISIPKQTRIKNGDTSENRENKHIMCTSVGHSTQRKAHHEWAKGLPKKEEKRAVPLCL